MHKLCGMAYSRKHKIEIPLIQVYQDLMEFIEGQGDAGKLYKERIIGKTALKRAPGEYWEIEIAFHRRYTLATWKAEDEHNRAKIRAQHYLKGMIEFIDAHYKEQDDALKNVGKGKG